MKHPAGIVASDVFSAFSDVDKSTGLFVCVIQAKSSGHHLEEALSSFESALTLIVRPSSGVSGSGTAGEPQVLSIEFIPAFVVHTTQLHLNHVQVSLQLRQLDLFLFKGLLRKELVFSERLGFIYDSNRRFLPVETSAFSDV